MWVGLGTVMKSPPSWALLVCFGIWWVTEILTDAIISDASDAVVFNHAAPSGLVMEPVRIHQ